jgi:hypothetical protein
VSVILALALAQAPAVVGTVPVPNAELDAAYACLNKGAERLLAQGRPAPDEQARWGWALEVVMGCEDQINAAADSKEAIVIVDTQVSHGNGISKRDMLRAEANYFVDRLIREHYEAKE